MDELFDTKTPIPEWSLPATFDGDTGYLWHSEDYTFSNDSTWTNRLLPFFTFKTGNGVYQISSSDNNNRLLSLHEDYIQADSFYIEVEMLASFPSSGISGIFGGYEQSISNHSFNYFTVSSGNRSYAFNTDCMSAPFAEVLISDKFRHGTYNKLALSKRGDELFFYINDELVYRNDYQLPLYNRLGVVIPARGSVSIKNYAVYTAEQSSGLRAARPAENLPRVYVLPPLPGMEYLR